MKNSSTFDAAKELEAIRDQLEMLDNFLVDYSDGRGLGSDGEVQFKELTTSALSILDDELGKSNRHSVQISQALADGYSGYPEAYSAHCLKTVRALVNGGSREVRRSRGQAVSAAPELDGDVPYVSVERIDELRSAKSARYDTKLLVRLCEELNIAHANKCYLTVPMQVRTILNHVPPIFGHATFEQVVGQYGDRAVKGQMDHLQESLRKVADHFLHGPIRRVESIPVFQEIDFRRELGALLAEIVRLLQTEASRA